MHWMLYFVIVCKSLKVCWVCIYALPCCSSLKMLKSRGAPLSAVAHTWLPTYVMRSGCECTGKCIKRQHWGTGVRQDKAIL